MCLHSSVIALFANLSHLCCLWCEDQWRDELTWHKPSWRLLSMNKLLRHLQLQTQEVYPAVVTHPRIFRSYVPKPTLMFNLILFLHIRSTRSAACMYFQELHGLSSKHIQWHRGSSGTTPLVWKAWVGIRDVWMPWGSQGQVRHWYFGRNRVNLVERAGADSWVGCS